MILDHRGNPIERGALTREIAKPNRYTMRHYNFDFASGLLSPSMLEDIYLAAEEGELHEFFKWTMSLVKRDFKYKSVLSTRVNTIKGLKINVEAAGEDRESQEDARLVENHLAKHTGLKKLLTGLLSGLNTGLGAAEIVWQRGKIWNPQFYWRDPRLFCLDNATLSDIRLRNGASIDGDELAAFKFIIHQPDLEAGGILANALGTLGMQIYVMRSFNQHQWLQFAENGWRPLRIGKYNKVNVESDDLAILNTAVHDFGVDWAAVIPDSMRMEILEVKNASAAADIFDRLAGYLDAAHALLVLGQTRSSDENSAGLHRSSESGGERDSVRQDILVADSGDIDNTLQRQLVEPFIKLNRGERELYPQMQLHVPNYVNLQALTDMIERLAPLGLEVDGQEVLNRWGLPNSKGEPLKVMTK